MSDGRRGRRSGVPELRAGSDMTTTEFPSADAVAAIRRAVLDAEIRPPSRWRTLTETSPSGKTLFQCGTCGVVTTAPNKVCGAGCSDG